MRPNFVTTLVPAGLILICGIAGCRTSHAPLASAPSRHVVRANQLLIRSDLELDRDHPLVTELTQLGGEIQEILDLPEQRNDVAVYLFETQVNYKLFLDEHFPNLPDRRAYFVGSPKELAVYTFWGRRIQEDLRHEYTHGLLHASLKEVPLWLDEGLAEYFEVPGETPGNPNSEYVHRMAASLYEGWRPNLVQLESIRDFSKMTYFDYQHSWSWVHFLLNATPETRETLIGYIRDLRTDSDPLPLSHRLENKVPDLNAAFAEYIRRLHEEDFARAEHSQGRQHPGSNLAVASDRTTKRVPTTSAGMTATESVGNGIQLTSGVATNSTVPNPLDDPMRFPIQTPKNLPAVVMQDLPDGTVQAIAGELLFRESHKTGWQEVLELFLRDELNSPTQESLRAHADRTRNGDGDVAHEARISGMIDAAHALQVLSNEQGEEALRRSIQSHRAAMQ